MFYTTRYYYPHGIEGEAMECTFKAFRDINKAIKYCHRYAQGVRFAGVRIEDEKGKTIYEITSDFEVLNNLGLLICWRNIVRFRENIRV